MNVEEAYNILSSPFAHVEEYVQALEIFFNQFDVDIQNPDGTYKSLYNIFKEANENYRKRKE